MAAANWAAKAAAFVFEPFDMADVAADLLFGYRQAALVISYSAFEIGRLDRARIAVGGPSRHQGLDLQFPVGHLLCQLADVFSAITDQLGHGFDPSFAIGQLERQTLDLPFPVGHLPCQLPDVLIAITDPSGHGFDASFAIGQLERQSLDLPFPVGHSQCQLPDVLIAITDPLGHRFRCELRDQPTGASGP